MPLSQERIGQIAKMILQVKLESDGGICLQPKEIAREISNHAKKLGINQAEAAEFYLACMCEAFEKCKKALEAIIADPK
ncbi:MAG: hypothetical protein KBD47_01995 [Candidatus Pacebacteria bacterium]|nr:hypothetical protein [Candidatus Paceibacterota bacterium]